MVTQLEFLISNLNLLTSTFAGRNPLIIVLGVLEIVMSVLTVLAYRYDKQKSKDGEWRTKEKTLLALPWLMGGIGGFIGTYVIRHKNQKWYFVLNNFIALVVQFGVFAALIILG